MMSMQNQNRRGRNLLTHTNGTEWISSILFAQQAGESAGNLAVRKLVLPDLCSYADIPVMQTSEYGNRNKFTWA
jgi:hypothetical protein